jgi:c-di-GMP-binding flagellar brake protein YcgR
MDSGVIKKDKNFADMRKSKRINYSSKIYCSKSIYNSETEEYEEPLELMLLNVSAGGLGIASDKLFENDSVLVLRMELKEVSYDKVTAKVLWNIKKGDIYRYGLEIINISGKLFRHLNQLDNSITTTV